MILRNWLWAFLWWNTDAVFATNHTQTVLCNENSMREGLNYYSHPTLCTHFLQCDTALRTHTRKCSNGLFFDQQAMACVFPYDTDCLQDPCYLNPTLRAYSPSDDPCSEYFACKDGWTFEKQCCDAGLSFDGERGCKVDASCQAGCDKNITTIGRLRGNCTNIPVSDNKRQFKMLNHGSTVTMNCAPGTFYDVTTCECSILDLVYLLQAGSSQCVPTIKLDFKGGKISSFEDKSGLNTFVAQSGLGLSREGPRNGDERSAVFTGKSDQTLFFPRFTFSEYTPLLRIFMTFKLFQPSEVDDSLPEALVTNSDHNACSRSNPSIQLFIERNTSTVKAVVHTLLPRELMAKSTNLLKDDWNNLTMMYDGESLLLDLNDISEKTLPTGNPAKIVPVQCALHVGSGRGMQTLNGLIDMFELSLC